jgi:hypothetical protein
MTSPNLLVTFTLAGDNSIHVRGAARIRVDGRGGLTLIDTEKGNELVNLACLQSLTIRTVPEIDAPSRGLIQ